MNNDFRLCLFIENLISANIHREKQIDLYNVTFPRDRGQKTQAEV